MVQSAGPERVAQGPHNVLLPDQGLEALGRHLRAST